jgi:hypothetical protein
VIEVGRALRDPRDGSVALLEHVPLLVMVWLCDTCLAGRAAGDMPAKQRKLAALKGVFSVVPPPAHFLLVLSVRGVRRVAPTSPRR